MRRVDETPKTSPRGAITDAGRWVLESGIQVLSGEDAGAFRSWEDPDDPGFPYSEVTGYGIGALCGPLAADVRAVDRARLAARWLVVQVRAGRAFRCRKVQGRLTPLLCTFDNGVIARALRILSERTGDREWLEAARAVADWIVAEMRDASGTLVPRYDLDRGGPVPFGDRWSSRPGAYQARVAFALLDVARRTGDERGVRAAARLCERLLGEQAPDGRFVTDGDSGGTYLHAHAYAVEGLAACGAILGRDDITEAARRGLRWALSLVADRGFVPAHHHPDRGPDLEEHSDSTAQVLRLLLCLEGPGPYADRLAQRLLAFQCRDADPRRRGGFLYARRGGEWSLNVTTHGTLFAIQALQLYERGARGFEWRDLL